MSRPIWSPAALREVQGLHHFLAGKNVGAAKRAVQAIRDGVKAIAQQPGIGRPVDDMEPEFREWLINFGEAGNVALYRYDGERAVILAVRRQREAGY